MITVSINSEPTQVAKDTPLNMLLEQHPPQGTYAVAINGEFVPRSRYAETVLGEGDKIDLVSPVGGG